MYRSIGCGLEKRLTTRGRDGAKGSLPASTIAGDSGHEATAASGEMATAGRKRAARAGGGKLGEVKAMDEVEDAQSKPGWGIWQRERDVGEWRFRPDSEGGVDENRYVVRRAHDWQHWARCYYRVVAPLGYSELRAPKPPQGESAATNAAHLGMDKTIAISTNVIASLSQCSATRYGNAWGRHSTFREASTLC